MTAQFCLYPFKSVQINNNGEVCSCCFIPFKNGKFTYSFGNFLQQNFDEIWNGQKAQKFRQDIINGKYSFCCTDLCKRNNSLTYFTENSENLNKICEYPEIVNLGIDYSCNVRCVMCRDTVNFSKTKYIDNKIEERLLSVFKNAKIVNPCLEGEFFVSRVCQMLVKKAILKYPNIMFNIFSNGILCDEQNFNNLALHGRVNKLRISLHATSKETYDKIVKGGDFNRVIKNIKWAAEQKNNGNIQDCKLNFVVSSLNYKEMPSFAKMAIDLGVKASFWELRSFESSVLSKNIKAFAVFEKTHPAYPKLVEILQNPVFLSENIQMNDKLKKIIQLNYK